MASDARGPARRNACTVRIDCRVRAAGRANRVVAIASGADGARRLRAEVTAPAGGGKANRALLKLLAKFFAIAPSRWSVVVGAGRREKTLAIVGVTGEEWARVEAALAALEGGERER